MKKSIVGVGIFVVFCLLIVGAYRMGQESNRQETSTEQKSAVVQSENQVVVENNTEDKQTEDKATAVSADNSVNVKYSCSNSWESNGKTYTNIEVVLTNQGTEGINSWQLETTVPAGAKLDQFWNGDCKIKDNRMTVKPMDYNQSIAAGAEVSFGFILIAEKKYSPKVKETTVTCNGDSVAVSGNNSQDEDSESANNTAGDTANQSQTGDSSGSTEETVGSGTDETTNSTKAVKVAKAAKGSAYRQHGKLKVKGTRLVDAKGKTVRLKGVSTHGIAWFPEYVNKKAFKTLRDKMKVNLIRLALYSDQNSGYSRSLYKKVDQGVKYATELGMYVIIDWHILSDGNPKTNQKEAKHFFKRMSKRYKKYGNVMYEICNEPNGDVTWTRDIKPYATKIIKTIRKQDKDAVIIVGTPTWSQDVDVVAENPVKGQKNIMYALHFYASTHKEFLRDKAKTAINKGLPLFVTEFSICEASGNGYIDKAEGNRWIKFLKKNNISFCIWSLCNKDEAASLLKPGCDKLSGWKNSDLSTIGKWYKSK